MMDEAIQNIVDQVAPPSADSTVLDNSAPDGTSGRGYTPEPVEDTVKSVLQQVKAEAPTDEQPAEAEVDPKAEPEVKAKEDKPAEVKEEAPEDAPTKPRAKDGKFAKTEPVEAAPDEAPQEKSEFAAPERLLPDAKERWTNTPRSVQRDISAFVTEVEQERAQYSERLERYENIRPFDELAKSNGRDLRESLAKINHIENLIQKDPIVGLDTVLKEMGSRYSLYDVAQHIVNQGPQAYQQTVQQARGQMQEQQQQSYVQQLEQQVQQLAQEQKKIALKSDVIEPFRAANPRFDEPDIQTEMALQINMLRAHPKYAKAFNDLSYQGQLAIAYERADRQVPASPSKQASAQNGLDPYDARVEHDSSGTKSIKSGPGAVSNSEDLTNLPLEELLKRNLSKVSKRG